MDNEQLLTFLTVSELNNYSRTADYLNLTQPAVTARIQKLELELGSKLFYRDGKKILLTEEGKALVPYAKKILSYVNEARQTLNTLKSPSLTIGISPAISASIILQVLSLQREKSELSIDIVEANDSAKISDMVSTGQIDIGFARDVAPLGSLESKKLLCEKLVFIVGKEHPLASKREIIKDDLIGHTLICYRRQTPIWKSIDEKFVGINNLKRIEVGSFEMVKLMVKNHWGFSIIPQLEIAHDTDKISNDFQIIPFNELVDLTYNIRGIYKKDSPKLDSLQMLLHYFETTLKELQMHEQF